MNCKTITFICLFWYSLFFASCSKSEDIRELLSQAESNLLTNTDSAVSILNNIADIKLSDKEQADYWRLQTTVHFLKGKSIVEDTAIIASLEYYKNHNLQKELKETYKLVLNHLLCKNDTTRYKYYIMEAKRLAQDSNDSLFTSAILQLEANEFTKKGDYRSAYSYYTKASEYNNSNHHVYYKAVLSYCYINNDIDTLDYWMQKAVDIAKLQKDTASIFHYYRNYADILISLKKYDKALINIRQSEKYNTHPFNIAPFTIAIIYMQQHKLDSARYHLNKMADQDLETSEQQSFLITKKGLAFLNNIIDYTQGGNLELQLIGQYTDAINRDRNLKNKKFEEQMLAKQRLYEENKELIIKKQRIQLLLLSLICIASISIFFIYLYIRRKKEKLLQMEEKMSSIQELLASVSDDFKKNREKSAYFKKVLLQQLGVIRMAASNPTSHNQEMLQRIAKITNDEVPVDSLIIWDDLYLLIDSLYDGFYTKMTKKFEDRLIEKEIQLCCLLCADFTTKEIGVITQQSVRTIYQRKTTIREKLRMEQAEDIVEFIRK